MTSNKTMSFTLRGVPEDLEKNLSAVAMMEGKSRNQLILDTLIKEFSNPIATYGRKSPLVKAMDIDMCNKLDCKLIENWYENEHIIYAQKKYCLLLKLNSESDVDEMFKRNIALIEFRARQLKARGYGSFALGISLNFALFIEVARSDRDIIENVKNQIFKISQDNFDEDINEVRKELGLPAY
ncbi:hypothetical protein V4V56_003283 [Vibrio mimicus]|uniref:hypothetical protein n=1 Tax=Vibrio TaxID=662 RepID=UPI00084A8066|nr:MULTISPECIES: hypothetical protein [Vibrio]ELG5191702.1 hypothetical protein [Vibrio vulnificus]ELS9253900.1 hypothetical protein [Vibrio parahaemolyticus]OEA26643.1 hypothetical protein BBM55_00405 [Vibrio parahaemolyticus]